MSTKSHDSCGDQQVPFPEDPLITKEEDFTYPRFPFIQLKMNSNAKDSIPFYLSHKVISFLDTSVLSN